MSTDPITGPGARRSALVRLLSAAAWADGVLTTEERTAIQRVAGSLRLSDPERREVDRLLEQPISIDDFEKLAREMLASIGTPEEGKELLAQVEKLVDADRKRSPEETRYLELLRQWMNDSRPLAAGRAADEKAIAKDSSPPSAAGLLRQTQGFFSGIRRAASQAMETARPSSLAGSLAATLLGRPGTGQAGLNLTSARRDHVTLFGALLDRVMRADGVVRPEECDRVRWVLSESFGFTPFEVEHALELIEARLTADVDRQHLCASFNRITEMEDRLRLLSALFAVGLSDGELSAPEEREIRLIANYLWIETQEYVHVRREAIGAAAAEEQRADRGNGAAGSGRRAEG